MGSTQTIISDWMLDRVAHSKAWVLGNNIRKLLWNSCWLLAISILPKTSNPRQQTGFELAMRSCAVATFIVLFWLTTIVTQAASFTAMTTEEQPPNKKQKVDASDGVSVVHVADESSDRLAPWADRWGDKRIGFHLSEVNPIIKKYADKLFSDQGHNEETDACSNTRVFVPLCGKTVDMAYLVTMSAEVVGVEGIRQALQEFSEEQPDLKIVSKGIQSGFERFEGDKISLLKGDFFELDDSKTNGKFGVIFDRASLVAIDPSIRDNYVKTLGELIAPGGKILLVVLERRGTEEAMKKGPPFSVPDAIARGLFEGQEWVDSMTLLQQSDQLEERPEERKRYEGLDKLLEVVYLIQAKV